MLRGRIVSDVPVERLAVGDLAITHAGKPRPIRWIGSRSYPGLSAPKHDRPVRIRADAISPGVPARDLLVSPDHALWLGGLFVAAGHLVNGTSVTRGEAVRDLTYWHLELDSHDLSWPRTSRRRASCPPQACARASTGSRLLMGRGARALRPADRTRAPSLQHCAGAWPAAPARRAGRRSGPRAGMAGPVCDPRGRRTALGGWAQDAAQPNTQVCLDVIVDGAVVASR